MSVQILVGDCMERMGGLDDNSVDSVVCDPPYHLTSIVKRFGKESSAPCKAGKTGAYARASRGFMGQQWDGGDIAFRPELWAEVLRVLKPGGHLVAFSGTRTYHRTAVAIEDAGFEIRDQLAWCYGSGFPKSHNLDGDHEGWGTALKPAWEPIALARKPISEKNIAANVLKWGTGALHIDGCRVGFATEADRGSAAPAGRATGKPLSRLGGRDDERAAFKASDNSGGRWPANICHDGSEEVVSAFPNAPGQQRPSRDDQRKQGNVYGTITNNGNRVHEPRDDEGSAARFFYCAKATSGERGEGNNHPTVKPIALMKWLITLVTPKDGLVLDPFLGSGSTGVAADELGHDFIGCELSADYAAIAERRVRASAGMFASVEVKAA